MTFNANSRYRTIPNQPIKHKQSERSDIPCFYGVFVALGLILVLFTNSYRASAEPVEVAIGWQVPVRSSEVFTLEIASDPGFAKIVHTDKASGRDYKWQCNEEGVYHWQLLRPLRDGAEPSTFVSGSFVAISAKASRKKPVKISWDAVEGADSYKLLVLENGTHSKTIVTRGVFYLISGATPAMMIEVVPFAGSRRVARHFQYDKSLKYSGGDAPLPKPEIVSVEKMPAVAPEELPKPVEEVKAEPTPEPAAVAEEPKEEPKPVVEPTPEPEPVKEEIVLLPGLRRVHLIGLSLMYDQEAITADKSEINFVSEEQLVGYAGELWSNPIGGMVINLRGDYHEHEAEITQNESFPDKTIEISQSRFNTDMTLGWDLLSVMELPNHLFALSIAGAMVQLPRLPLEFEGAEGTLPGFEKEQLTFFGGALNYTLFRQGFAVGLEAASLSHTELDATYVYQRLFGEYYPTHKLAVTFGCFKRTTKLELCHSDDAVCEKEGKVTTSIDESGCLLGVGSVLF